MPPFMAVSDFFRFDLHKDVPIYSADGPLDFVTKSYAIFPDVQIVMNLLWILRGRSPVGIDSAKVPRLGVIPRYAEDESEMWWMDAPVSTCCTVSMLGKKMGVIQS
ncbi:UNVERIFIED_CONTAM: 9-cis-epoxycarotenoid dioxygenase NCED1, chloroplastic [Sesamum radiatum]|uniref:9-cis-epoxycarotenoid dioxygenase NCED1, chloroplastic n=1 Tax=Sesamum radiatum TaxID=300843 RepID=A0AAW2JUV3_SESRA